MTNYRIAKNTLLWVSRDVKSTHRDDKALIRQVINDTADSLIRDNQLNNYQSNLLTNYAAKLHPKR